LAALGTSTARPFTPPSATRRSARRRSPTTSSSTTQSARRTHGLERRRRRLSSRRIWSWIMSGFGNRSSRPSGFAVLNELQMPFFDHVGVADAPGREPTGADEGGYALL